MQRHNLISPSLRLGHFWEIEVLIQKLNRFSLLGTLSFAKGSFNRIV